MEVLDWLKSDQHPRDLYDLVCAKKFDPDPAALRKVISQASRELLPYQGHANPDMARNAMRLLTDLGGADMILGNEAKLTEHNQHVAESLLDDYLDETGLDIDDVDRRKFASWLVESSNVHPDAVKTVVQVWLKESLPAPVPKNASGKSAAKSDTAPKRKVRRRRQGPPQTMEELFSDLGVSERRTARRPSRSPSRARSTRGGRSRAKQSSTPWLPIGIGAGVVLVLIVLVIILAGGKDKSSVMTVVVVPAEATITTDFEAATITSDGGRHQIRIEDADQAKDGIQVSVALEGYLDGGFRWTPVPGQEVPEQNVTLRPDFDARKRAAEYTEQAQ